MRPRKRRLPTGPWLVAADGDGNVFEIPGLLALGRSGGCWMRPLPRKWAPLPQGSLLFRLPDRRPVGWDATEGRAVVLDEYEGREVFAACAFLPPAHTALHLAAWKKMPQAGPLPLYAYCALGFHKDGFVAPAVRVDPDRRQDLVEFDEQEIRAGARAMLERHPDNRLAAHLVENCALDYCCPAARNWVLGRWEAPLPTSPACNADCVGCLSFQPGKQVPVTQPRLRLVPEVREIVELAVEHLESAPRAVVSFGQGCEGEPLLQADRIEAAIREIRRHTQRGTIHLNSNASRPEAVERLVAAGLDSLRISLNSCREDLYERYYHPRGYGLDALVRSARAVSRAGGLVSLNYFIFPGVTDTDEEFDALVDFIRDTGARVLQCRNLNIDPDLYLEALGMEPRKAPGFGIDRWMDRVRQAFPHLCFAYFNPPREEWPAPSPQPGR
ncbi:MAG: radical SAM protein [Acidobacteriota bacterium]|nr:radical SAM protein [Acidobacteriota bacterium]